MNIWQAFLPSLLGMTLLFLGTVIGMAIIYFIVSAIKRSAKKQAEPAAAAPEAKEPAPGTFGSVKLYNTQPKTAAMIMAIVADKTNTPINELRFISIKQVD